MAVLIAPMCARAMWQGSNLVRVVLVVAGNHPDSRSWPVSCRKWGQMLVGEGWVHGGGAAFFIYQAGKCVAFFCVVHPGVLNGVHRYEDGGCRSRARRSRSTTMPPQHPPPPQRFHCADQNAILSKGVGDLDSSSFAACGTRRRTSGRPALPRERRAHRRRRASS